MLNRILRKINLICASIDCDQVQSLPQKGAARRALTFRWLWR
jgi:hypothetical protein